MRRHHLVITGFLATATAAALAQTPALPPGYGPNPKLPPPSSAAPAINFARVVGWPEGKTPTAPAGFPVAGFGDNLQHPR